MHRCCILTDCNDYGRLRPRHTCLVKYEPSWRVRFISLAGFVSARIERGVYSTTGQYYQDKGMLASDQECKYLRAEAILICQNKGCQGTSRWDCERPQPENKTDREKSIIVLCLIVTGKTR